MNRSAFLALFLDILKLGKSIALTLAEEGCLYPDKNVLPAANGEFQFEVDGCSLEVEPGFDNEKVLMGKLDEIARSVEQFVRQRRGDPVGEGEALLREQMEKVCGM